MYFYLLSVGKIQKTPQPFVKTYELLYIKMRKKNIDGNSL